MVTRWEITKAVRASDLPAPARLVMLVLADVAEVGTAEIPAKFTPSLTVLATETGLNKSTVKRHLAALESAGWVVRTRPDAKAQWQGERTRYRLDLPRGIEPPVGAEEAPLGAQDAQGERTEPPGVGAESHKGRRTVRHLETDLSDQGQIKSDHPTPVASEVIDAEIVDETPNLPAVVEIPNAGQLTRKWIDYCAENGVKLAASIIKRYAKAISDAQKQGFSADLIKRALAHMLADSVQSRPSLFDSYLVRVQSGPARKPRTLTPGEATAARFANGEDGAEVRALLADILNPPAEHAS